MLQLNSEKIPLTADDKGVLRISGTRVPLDSIVDMFDEGAAPEEIVEQFDTLKLDDVYAVITYYLRHRREVKAHLAEGDQRAGETRRRIEEEFPSTHLRQRLLKAKREREDHGT